ncbi:ABC transporter permease [Alteromonas sp. ASW11-36]|uniref:ABC transporter permease n=2 Tax=Alteromonas arenosi TaxID=3055817 RepID=A0ABT7SXR0_9ALTE|nr:FtsX-like permease family protein [Alteromonas sp. ASW11-36]MDM7860980.1 ABC transporter permease [Alteromonas sp. ASW11-36]
MRNKVGALLIAIQIAVTMTIVLNSISIVVERDKMMQRASGLDEQNTFYLTSTGYTSDFNAQNTVTEDLLAIRAIPGVVDAIQLNAIPISGGGWSMSLATEAGPDVEGTGTAVYMVDEHGLETLDLDLIAGRNFTANEIRWRQAAQPDWPETVIITEALALTIFDNVDAAVGQTVYIGNDEPMTIIGVIDQLQAPWVGWNNLEHSMLSPENMAFNSTRYLIRTEDGERDRLMPIVEEMLAARTSGRIIRNMDTLTATRDRSYRQHNAMIKILLTVIVCLTLITALGIVGLASFSVQKRIKQIGTKRALGASQASVMRYFMLENGMISTVGLVLGTGLTIGLNMLLVNWFNLTPLDWMYIPIGVISLLIVGQIAVLGPARRAANIAPATATRTL